MNILESIQHWEELGQCKANFAQAFGAVAKDPFEISIISEVAKESLEAFNVARALKLQRDTGKIHCPCKNPPHVLN